MKKIVIFLFFVFLTSLLIAQNAANGIFAQFNYGVGLPAGDLAKRFGIHQLLGTGAEFHFFQKNIILGGDINYFFGKNVKENPTATLVNVQNYIYGADRGISTVLLRERGVAWRGYLGKIFPIGTRKEALHGIRANLGVGWTQHKIRLQDDSNQIVQIQGDYQKGYDRLTGGLTTSQFIGYQYLANNRRINFMAGFEFYQVFGKSLRDWDFDLKSKNTDKRLDLLNNFRVTWILPFYLGDKAENDEY
jgi:hypothetical protein